VILPKTRSVSGAIVVIVVFLPIKPEPRPRYHYALRQANASREARYEKPHTDDFDWTLLTFQNEMDADSRAAPLASYESTLLRGASYKLLQDDPACEKRNHCSQVDSGTVVWFSHGSI